VRVDSKTAPCFLVHAADDGGVSVRKSVEFTARCAEMKVPVVCRVFAQGGHGFGLNGKGDSVNWQDLLKEGLASRNSPTVRDVPYDGLSWCLQDHDNFKGKRENRDYGDVAG
jgi:acetyl esterase/lipase